MTPPHTRTAWITGAIVLLGAALRTWGLASQPLLGDEQWATATALHYVRSGQLGPTMWYHPHLRDLVLWAVGEAAGQGPVALRAVSVALGVLSIPLTGALLHALTGDRTAALAAAFLVAIDQVHVTFSRQGIQETWTAFFILGGTTLAVLAWRRDAPALLALAGLSFGLGLSSKLHALFPLAVCGAAGLAIAWRRRSAATGAFVAAALGALPATIFLAGWAPWFARGYGFADWLELQRVLLLKTAAHRGNPMDQLIDVAPALWFVRPMGYASFTLAGDAPAITIAYSNPLVWTLVLPASAWAMRAALRRHDPAASGYGTLLALFAASYLPLALTARPIWILSAVAVLPFAHMLIGLAASRLLQRGPGARRLLAAYAAAATAASLALYPLAIGRGLDHAYLRPLVERFRPEAERAQDPMR